MKKTLLSLVFLLALATFHFQCKNPNTAFSPGAGDSRLTGTWRLLERKYSKDSTYTIRVKRDSLSIAQDTSKVKIDSIYIRRDTSFYTIRRYSASPPQTLTFETEGKLTRNGEEMTYYAPYRNYRVDKTYPDSLLLNLFIYTNGANVPVQQGLEFRQDTLVLKPRCDQPCYSKLLRVR